MSWARLEDIYTYLMPTVTFVLVVLALLQIRGHLRQRRDLQALKRRQSDLIAVIHHMKHLSAQWQKLGAPPLEETPQQDDP